MNEGALQANTFGDNPFLDIILLPNRSSIKKIPRPATVGSEAPAALKQSSLTIAASSYLQGIASFFSFLMTAVFPPRIAPSSGATQAMQVMHRMAIYEAQILNDAACTLADHGDFDHAVDLLREAISYAEVTRDDDQHDQHDQHQQQHDQQHQQHQQHLQEYAEDQVCRTLHSGSSGECAVRSDPRVLRAIHLEKSDLGMNSGPTAEMMAGSSRILSVLPIFHAEMSPQACLEHCRSDASAGPSSCDEKFSNSRHTAILLFNLGLIYRKSRSIDEAAKLFQMSSAAAGTEILGDRTENAPCHFSAHSFSSSMVYLYALNNLAECYFQQGKRNESVQVLAEATSRGCLVLNLIHQSADSAASNSTAEVLNETTKSLANFLVKIMANVGLLRYQAGQMTSALQLLNDALFINRSHLNQVCKASTADACLGVRGLQGDFSTVQLFYNLGLVLERVDRQDSKKRAREMFRSAEDLTLRLVSACTDGNVRERYGEYAPRIAVLVINKTALQNSNEEKCAKSFSYADMIRRHQLLEDKLDFSFCQGLDSAELAGEVNGLGAAYSDREDHDKALVFYCEGLRLETAVLGAKHPNLLITLNNIGQVSIGGYYIYRSLWLMLVLIVRVSCSSPYTPDILFAYSQQIFLNRLLSQSLHSQGNYSAAMQNYKSALILREEACGLYDHLPVVPTLMHNVALIYMHSERQSDALPLFQSSLSLQRAAEMSTGTSSDKDVFASSLYNVGVILSDRGRLEEATEALQNSIDVRRRSGDADDCDIAEAISRIARILQARGENSRALATYEKIMVLDLSPDRDDDREILLSTLCNMAQLCHGMMRQDDALRHYISALEILRSFVAPCPTPDVNARAIIMSILSAVAGIHSERGDITQAREYIIEQTRVSRVNQLFCLADDNGLDDIQSCLDSNMPAPAA